MCATAGTTGGGIAGFIGGFIYGFAGASQPLAPGVGAVSVLLVLLCLTIFVALVGGVGVSLGIAMSARFQGRYMPIAGGALGGLAVGAIVKFLGLDAFTLLIGRSPGDITGPLEGVVIGGTAGMAYAIAAVLGEGPRWQRILVAVLLGAAGGVFVTILGGHMMAAVSPNFRTNFRIRACGSIASEHGSGKARSDGPASSSPPLWKEVSSSRAS